MSMTQMKCGHSGDFAPTPMAGEEVYCRKCCNYSTVVRVGMEWYWYCAACRISRRYGEDGGACRRAIGRHLRRKPGHIVQLWHGGEKVEDVVDRDQSILEWVQKSGHGERLRALSERYNRP